MTLYGSMDFDLCAFRDLEIYLVDTKNNTETIEKLNDLLDMVALDKVCIQNINFKHKGCRYSGSGVCDLYLGDRDYRVYYTPFKNDITLYNCYKFNNNHKINYGGFFTCYFEMKDIKGLDKYFFSNYSGFYNKRKIRDFNSLDDVYAISLDGDSLLVMDCTCLVKFYHKGKLRKKLCIRDINKNIDEAKSFWRECLKEFNPDSYKKLEG